LTAQLRLHLESLRSAGVEWLPAPVPLPSPASGDATLDALEAPPAAAAPKALFEDKIIAAVAPAEERRRELTVLAERVSGCMRCKELAATRTQTVFGVGRIDPDVCFVGEAPGADEDAQGEPFVGAAGQLLNKILAACGLTRDDVYICNILKCRPPGNRTPRPDEAAFCREYL